MALRQALSEAHGKVRLRPIPDDNHGNDPGSHSGLATCTLEPE